MSQVFIDLRDAARLFYDELGMTYKDIFKGVRASACIIVFVTVPLDFEVIIRDYVVKCKERLKVYERGVKNLVDELIKAGYSVEDIVAEVASFIEMKTGIAVKIYDISAYLNEYLIVLA